jgi:prevent-host-death family protein
MCVTLSHMKVISIRELHARTGKLVREAKRYGQILVTDNGRTIAKIVPEAERAEAPYFARRKFINREARKLIESGETGGGTDSTVAISEDREDRV